MKLEFAFANPWWLLWLLILVPMYWKYRRKNQPSVSFSSLQHVNAASGFKTWMFSHLFFTLRCLSIILLVLAMARPQSGRGEIKERTEGLDIILVLDTSGSMRGLDFNLDGRRHTRLDVVKKVLGDFIVKRTDDRLGMVVFGTNAFSQAPLTLDHDVLLRFLEAVNIGMAGDQTAIGDAMAVGINRLKDLEAKSKIMILLTDGSNTAGQINPKEMIKAAKLKGVKVYTVGVGSKGRVPVRTRYGIQHVKMDLDESLLKEIANETGGKYFRAKSTEGLKAIYSNIDQLEKTKKEVQVFHNYEEKYSLFLWPGLMLFLLEMILNMTGIRRIP